MVVRGFHLCGWDVADLAVEAAVVEPFDVRQCGQLDLVDNYTINAQSNPA